MSKSKILFHVSGSIAAFKAASVVSQLVKDGHDVKVVFSPSAEKFIGASTFEGLTGHRVYSDIFDAQEPMAHIDLARWADVMVLCPASANVLAQLAHGFASDLIGTLFLAKEEHIPYLIFPAMNQQMWAATTTQANVKILNHIPGVQVISPDSGLMACGEVGEGRLPEPADILKVIRQYENVSTLNKKSSSFGAVLITGGGTSEPIDSVRSITNFSTGKTSVGLADHLKTSGYDVDLLLANSAQATPSAAINTQRFTTHEDLSRLLKEQLSSKDYSAVIHLAAVSDFTLPEASQGKISSKQDQLELKLVPTPKIVSHLKEWSKNKSTKMIGFKLTYGDSIETRQEKAFELMQKSQLNGVVFNDLSEINTTHPGTLVTNLGTEKSFETKQEMYQTLEHFLKENV